MRWRLLIEEFGPEFRHIKSKHNLKADALSRLELDDSSKESNLEKIYSSMHGSHNFKTRNNK
jgi:hypothetical protein